MTITADEPQRPSLEMLRRLTDRRVFQHLLEADALTRAEVASRTGISKPTISESVRRLIDGGLVGESGRQVGGRGRAGTYCHLRTDTATALAISVGPDGIIADTFDLKDRQLRHVEQPVTAPVNGVELEPLLLATARSAVDGTPGTIRSCVVSVAGPVDRQTGRLTRLSYSPFVVGEFSPAQVLRALAPFVEVDNDVNWAALAEHRHGNAADLDDFVLCYLGEGIGGAIMLGGTVLVGAHGVAGELAHARTTGPGGRSLTLFECFRAWDLLRPGSEAIDVDRVRRVLEAGTAQDRERADEIATAVAGVLDSTVALIDPQGILVGGPWGSTPGLLPRIAVRMKPLAEPPTLRETALGEASYRDGIRIRSVAAARQAVADDF